MDLLMDSCATHDTCLRWNVPVQMVTKLLTLRLYQSNFLSSIVY